MRWAFQHRKGRIWADWAQVFAGPMSESVPSSTTGFAHRRTRADSTASFTYLQDNEESSGSSPWPDDEVIEDPSDDEQGEYDKSKDGDVESNRASSRRRKSSGFSRLSVEDPLLNRRDSTKTDASVYGRGGRSTQKIYIISEDLTVVVAGFSTSHVGLAAYLVICLASLGLGYLLFRWFPRLKVRLIGSQTPLRDCSWVVIEVGMCLEQPGIRC